MQQNTLVSIIIPCYNYAQYVGQAIESVQAQVYTNWECIVVDDGSLDETASVVRDYSVRDPRIKYFYQPNKGQPAARNTGLKKASGEWIQFLDADDLLQLAKLAAQVAYLHEHPNADIVYSGVRYFDSSNISAGLFMNRWDARDKEWMPELQGKGRDIVIAFLKGNVFELGCALFRKRAVEQTGWFDEDLQGVEDYDYCLRSALNDLEFHYFNAENSFVLMRHHENSYSKNLLKMYKKELMLRRKANNLLRQSGFHALNELLQLNSSYYNKRLRQLHNLLIDATIKGNGPYDLWQELKWQYRYSGIGGILYYFPRILKARFLH